MIKRLTEECGVAMYCDMHAHSRKHNIFIYGCENKREPDKKLTEQVFPLMLHKNIADKVRLILHCKIRISGKFTHRIQFWLGNLFTCFFSHFSSIFPIQFSFESCKFKVQRSKEGTGRIVVWMLGITNSYTMEASFGGSTLGSRAMTHFSTSVRINTILSHHSSHFFWIWWKLSRNDFICIFH